MFSLKNLVSNTSCILLSFHRKTPASPRLFSRDLPRSEGTRSRAPEGTDLDVQNEPEGCKLLVYTLSTCTTTRPRSSATGSNNNTGSGSEMAVQFDPESLVFLVVTSGTTSLVVSQKHFRSLSNDRGGTVD